MLVAANIETKLNAITGALLPNVVWRPLPGSQVMALSSPCNHTLYEGARGPGKTVTQLMRFYRNVGKGYGRFWKGIIFDLEFDHLGGIVSESKKWFGDKGILKDGAKFLESASQYKWVWPTGEELLFRHVKKVADYEGFHGHEYPFIGWNELTKHPTSALYDKFMSCNRVTFEPITDTPKDAKTGEYLTPNKKPLKEIMCEVFSTTNPSGPGHNWVKRRFINVAPRGVVVKTEVEIFNPQTQQNDTVVKTQVTIFGSYRENIYLPPSYIAELESITDENLRKAWLYGDWDVTAGGAFDDLWKSHIHVIPRFVIPHSWRIDRSYDDGSSAPFSVGWWAESDGTEATIVLRDGRQFIFCPPAGTLVQIFEWYGTKEIGTNKGLKLSATSIAKGIKLREESMEINGWIQNRVWAGPADNRIRNVIDSELETTEGLMNKQGVSWLPSDKSPGSRIIGLNLVRERLENAVSGEGPAIYFMNNCVASIEILPSLPRDPEKLDDVDTDAEDHPWDMIRYRALKSSVRTAKIIKTVQPH